MASPKSIAVLTVLALLGIAVSARADDEQRGRAATVASGDASNGWDLALTGGFVATGLVDPAYALGNVTGQVTRVVLRQAERESNVNLGVAMFAQVFHNR